MAVSVSPTIPTESSTAAPAGGFSGWFKNIGDWIKSLSPAGATEYETAWTAVTITGSGWGSTGDFVEVCRIGKTVHLRSKINYTGAGITIPSDGNISAQLITTLPTDFWPVTRNANAAAGSIGRLASGDINPNNGGVYLAAVAPGGNIVTNEQFSLHGTWVRF